MKAFPALLLAAALLAPTVHAQETPAAPAPQEPAPAAESPAAAPTPAADTPAPASAAATEPAPAPAPVDLTPAKDVPLPKTESTLDLMPAQDTTPAPALEPALIPETPESMPKPEGSAIEEPKTEKQEKDKAKVKPNKTAAASDEMATRVRYRQIKTRAMKDPAIQAEWETAQAARTDYEKREALKRYYALLYSRMEKMDKSLKKEIEARKPMTVRRLQQTRIEPTVPPDHAPRVERVERVERTVRTRAQ